MAQGKHRENSMPKICKIVMEGPERATELRAGGSVGLVG